MHVEPFIGAVDSVEGLVNAKGAVDFEPPSEGGARLRGGLGEEEVVVVVVASIGSKPIGVVATVVIKALDP